ncbi:hypothetical protein LINPERHAP2_LOCUS13941 [Linum perenne]
MMQERLNELAMVAIENNLLEGTKIEELIDNFISKNMLEEFFFLSSNSSHCNHFMNNILFNKKLE